MGLVFLLTQAREYSRVGFAPRDGAFGTIFYCLTGLHGAHVFVGLSILLFMTIRAFAATSRRSTTGVEIGGIYWHFVDVMWIVVYSTVYLSDVINPLAAKAEATRFTAVASIVYFGAIVIASVAGGKWSAWECSSR
jgi:hypothetical protein